MFFYSHWGGSRLPETVAEALDRGRGRWSDPSYLARIIFAEMIKGDVLGETGYGISSQPTDTGDGHRIVNVNVKDRVVRLEAGDLFTSEPFTFDEFVKNRPSW